MTTSLFAACGALALAGSVTLAAQTSPTTRPQPPKPTPPAATGNHATTTVTGCLKAWESSMGTAPADGMAKPGAMTASTRYVLTDVDMGGTKAGMHGSMPPPSPTSPELPAGSAATAHPMNYIVMAGSATNLGAHLNHKVTLTGTVDHAHSGMPGMPGDKPMTRPSEGTPTETPKSDPMGMDHTKGADQAWPTITVSSVTMVSATCTGTPKP